MLQRSTRGDFGVSLGGATFLRVYASEDLTAEDTRDLLALFVTWLAVDPERVLEDTPRNGSFAMDVRRSERSNGRLVANLRARNGSTEAARDWESNRRTTGK
jgi:hypothetical protein